VHNIDRRWILFACHFYSPVDAPRVLLLRPRQISLGDETVESIEVPLVGHPHEHQRFFVFAPTPKDIAINDSHFRELGFSLALDQELERLAEELVCRIVIT